MYAVRELTKSLQRNESRVAFVDDDFQEIISKTPAEFPHELKNSRRYFAPTKRRSNRQWGREARSHLRVVPLKTDERELKQSVCLSAPLTESWKITQHLADEQGKRVRPALMKPRGEAKGARWREKGEKERLFYFSDKPGGFPDGKKKRKEKKEARRNVRDCDL